MNRTIKFRAWEEDTKKMIGAFEIESIANTHILTLGSEHILMQFTGISDWYEGDILENDTDWYKITYDISEARFEAVSINDGDNLSLGDLNVRGTQKMGNIYENPDLLSPHSPIK